MAVMRPSDWHIARLRRCLVNYFYPSNARQMEDNLHSKADRKVGIQHSFQRTLIRGYRLEDQAAKHPPSGPLWSVAAGRWEPRRETLLAAHIVPQSFGKRLMRRIFGASHAYPQLWGAENGLFLPAGVAAALDEWAIEVVPDLPPEDGAAVDAGPLPLPLPLKFRVLDPAHEELQRGIASAPEDGRLGRDLDQSPLVFCENSPEAVRPGLQYLYFWHCCAMLSRHRKLIKNDTNPRKSKKKAMLEEIDTRLPMTAFFDQIVSDLRRIEAGKTAGLNWSMDLKLPGVPGFESWLARAEEEAEALDDADADVDDDEGFDADAGLDTDTNSDADADTAKERIEVAHSA